jgi:hypothetical protein
MLSATPDQMEPPHQSGTTDAVTGAAAAAATATDFACLNVPLPGVGTVRLPPPHHLAFYLGVGALAALDCIEWPVALLLAVGKALADNRSHASLREFGEALESL